MPILLLTQSNTQKNGLRTKMAAQVRNRILPLNIYMLLLISWLVPTDAYSLTLRATIFLTFPASRLKTLHSIGLARAIKSLSMMT